MMGLSMTLDHDAPTVRTMPPDVLEHMRRHHVVTMSTTSFTGIPHADTVVYVNDERHLYFTAIEGSTIARNIFDNHYVAFTIDDYTTDWRKVRELKGVGRCQLTEGDEGAWEALGADKFGPDPVRPAGRLYSVTPGEVHFVDYDYASVTSIDPTVTERVFQIEEEEVPQPQPFGPVSTQLNSKRFEEGEVIFRPGQGTGKFFVVIEGEVEVRGEGFGSDQTVVRLGPGQLFGDQRSLRGQKGMLTAYAVKPTTLLEVEREDIRNLTLATGEASDGDDAS